MTITLTLNGPQSRALARAVKQYIRMGFRPADHPLLKAVAEQVLDAIEQKADQMTLEGMGQAPPLREVVDNIVDIAHRIAQSPKLE